MTQSPSFWVPEVLQSSTMDCGPAALQAVLRGFGRYIVYDEVRVRCGTDVDGTSIEALAAASKELGLSSRAMPIASDQLLLAEAQCLPAIVFTGADGDSLHFVVVWRAFGPFLQIMDPGYGRRWRLARHFAKELPTHRTRISRKRFEQWLRSKRAIDALRARMRSIGVSTSDIDHWTERLRREATAEVYGRLDAALRMACELVEQRSLKSGPQAGRALRACFDVEYDRIAARHFWVRCPSPQSELVELHGCVILHVSGAAAGSPAKVPASAKLVQPLAALWQLARQESGAKLYWLLAATAASSVLTLAEVLISPSLLYASQTFALAYQRVGSLIALAALISAQVWVDFSALAMVQRIATRLEARLLTLLHRKLPRLEDRQVRTRSVADLAGRVRLAHTIREVPALWQRTLRNVLHVIATTLGLLWIFPQGKWLLLACATVVASTPWFALRPLADRSARLRLQLGRLEHLWRDALTGAVAVRAHAGERAMSAEHEVRLRLWQRTLRFVLRASARVQAVQASIGQLCVVAIIAAYGWQSPSGAAGLLVAFWSLRLAAASVDQAVGLHRLYMLRGAVGAVLSPLSASESEQPEYEAMRQSGVALRLHSVSLVEASRSILVSLDVTIPAGAHVGVVGISGAGKSSLLGLLLGTSAPTSGTIEIDGELRSAVAATLRPVTSWVDPTVRLWDDSLLDNLLYACGDDASQLGAALEGAALREVVSHLPQGLQTRIGEAGVRLSGGQGQRARLGRAWLQHDARLVLLDEPFRGLAREMRRSLLQRVRKRFAAATLVFVSHDVSDTLDLDRVLVMSAGRIIEDGPPRELQAHPHSQYARLLAAERALDAELWSASKFSRARLVKGALRVKRA